MEKIILCRGEAHTPARFWQWGVCERGEYTAEMKTSGWVVSENARYLSVEMIAYLYDGDKEKILKCLQMYGREHAAAWIRMK